jgi:protein-S-isoprenylcysteine O-methyltransferase Ste14
MKKTTFHTIVRIGTAAALLFPVAALALSGLTGPTPPITGGAVTKTSLQNLIESIVQFLITISVVVAVGYIIWGGLQFVRGKPDEGKETLKNGIYGVAIILGVGLILSTISRFVLTQSIG